MMVVRGPLRRVTARAVVLVLVLAWAALAAAVCPPPLTLQLAASGSGVRRSTQGGKILLVRAVLRNHDKTAALPDVSFKVALAAGLCPVKSSTAPALKPRQRATLEGTASGSVNVYWTSMTFKVGQARKFRIKALVANTLTGPATLPVEGLAWVGGDGQCSAAAGPLNVSRSESMNAACPDNPLAYTPTPVAVRPLQPTPTHTRHTPTSASPAPSHSPYTTGAGAQLAAGWLIQGRRQGPGLPRPHPLPADAPAQRLLQRGGLRPAMPRGPAREHHGPTQPRTDRHARGAGVLDPLLQRGLPRALPLQRGGRRDRLLVLRGHVHIDQRPRHNCAYVHACVTCMRASLHEVARGMKKYSLTPPLILDRLPQSYVATVEATTGAPTTSPSAFPTSEPTTMAPTQVSAWSCVQARDA